MPRSDGSAVTVDLDYAPPFDWDSIVDFLAARAIPGVEAVEPDRYRRTIAFGGQYGTIEVSPASEGDALTAMIRFPDREALASIVGRIRRAFDLDADVGLISSRLAGDPLLQPLVRARPGLRVPGSWDGFELAVRAMLGQQITVTGARRLIGRLVTLYGEPFRGTNGDGDENGARKGLTAVFPSADRVAQADLTTLGMPRARAVAISGVAAAVVADPDLFGPGRSLDDAVTRLTALPGIGDWTANYIAMRALREPDAFPAADVGLLRALTGLDGVRPTPAAVLARAEAWRPWRAYAAQHLWTSLAGTPVGLNRMARIDALAE